MKTRYADVTPYRTKDGSQIRELMHPDRHAARQLSLAEAIVPPGERTQRHCHTRSEEIYHVLQGHGRMGLGDDCFDLAPGDTVLIAPGTPHWVEATGPLPLRVLCACAPPYAHADTTLLD